MSQSLNPWLSNLVYGALGTAAGIIGPGSGVAYNVYRVNGNTSTSIISPNSLVIPRFNMYMQRTTNKVVLENAVFDLMCFEAKCDGTKLEPGDILEEIGPNAQEGAYYCVAAIRNRLPYRTILIRVENTSSLERMKPGAGAISQQPTSGSVSVLTTQGIGATTVEGRLHLTLDGGLYQMLAIGDGSLASLPVGMQPLGRIKEGTKLGLPTEYATPSFLLYVPPAPGFQVANLDIIKGSSSDTYMVQRTYYSGNVGMVGTFAYVSQTNT
jgi:hypothetical protein